MEGRKRRGRDWEEGTNIRKGPWKAEEDEVLINHVNKYGPRDWSSIRSKGLLHRTGKSCRLRWVNKLRPNLKNGCKFSAEEERIVIEMQSQIGNKWARIATHLPGRTDNDVKNFWSSRQKRLARILQASSSASSSSPALSLSSKPQRQKRRAPLMEVQKLSPLRDSRVEEESSSRAHSCTSSHYEDPSTSKLLSVDTSFDCLDCNYTNENPYSDPQPQVLFPHMPLPQLGITFSPESQDLMDRLDDPTFFSLLGGGDEESELVNGVQLPSDPSFFYSSGICRSDPGTIGGSINMGKMDTFLDDLPPELPDQFDPLPSPSRW